MTIVIEITITIMINIVNFVFIGFRRNIVHVSGMHFYHADQSTTACTSLMSVQILFIERSV